MTNPENESPGNISEPSTALSGDRHHHKPASTPCKFFATELDWLDRLIQRNDSTCPISVQERHRLIAGSLVFVWVPFYLSSFLLQSGAIRPNSESGTLLEACAKTIGSDILAPTFLNACVYSPLILGWTHFVLIFFWLFVVGHLIGIHLTYMRDSEVPKELLELSAVDYPIIFFRQSLNRATLCMLLFFVVAMVVVLMQSTALQIIQYLLYAVAFVYLLIVVCHFIRSLQHVAQGKLNCFAILQTLMVPFASLIWVAPAFVLLLVWKTFVLAGYSDIVHDWLQGRKTLVTELALYFSALFLPFGFLFVTRTRFREIFDRNGVTETPKLARKQS